MLKFEEKRKLEIITHNQILAYPMGINTRVLADNVYQIAKKTIPQINKYHIYGMLAWVYKTYGHCFLVKTPGYSIIV